MVCRHYQERNRYVSSDVGVEDKGGKMTEKKMYRLLNEFANEHPYAENIKVTLNSHQNSYEAKTKEGANYDYVVALSELVRGAMSFLYWARRKGKL